LLLLLLLLLLLWRRVGHCRGRDRPLRWYMQVRCWVSRVRMRLAWLLCLYVYR